MGVNHYYLAVEKVNEEIEAACPVDELPGIDL
jgi:hypothetical protein